VHVLQGERELARDNRTLARFHLDGIPPAPRGTPQVEVTFDVDANGIVNVKARDKGTGREQSVTVTAASTLGKEDVDWMVQEAQTHSAEDRARREEVELRNQADQMLYQADQVLKEHGERIPPDVRSEVESRREALVNATKGGDVNALRTAMDQFNESLQKVGQAVYQEAGTSGRPGQQGTEPGEQQGGDDDVIDADYREVR
jgi:molecular chaperone DnaK